jgi:glycosyltransferase involved in cell wall biosynthesis
VHHVEPIKYGAALERWAIRRADLVVVDSAFVSGQVESEFARVGMSAQLPRILVTGCGVPEPKSKTQRYGREMALTIGPVIERKRPLDMVKLWQEVLQSKPNAHLYWIGDGPLRSAAKTLASNLRINRRVHFIGRVKEQVKNDYLNFANLFVFMSKLEGCPLAVLEAMAAGLPVVAPYAGPLPGLLGTHQAVDEPEMARRIIYMLDHQKRAAETGMANRLIWQAQYTPAAWLDRIQAAYRSVL